VPPQNKNFTGRTELLDALRGSLSGQATAVLSAFPSMGGVGALHGMGGVGKTQMAVEYAYRSADQYDVVWWIPADQPMLVRSSLAALAPSLGLPPATATGTEEAANAVLDALRRGEPYSRWLLIFDNADEPEDIQNLLPHGPGHVLITSRNHRWEAAVETVSVDVFSRRESVEFLRKRAGSAISPEDADRLAAELGDLPLALEQAGALQAETGMPVEEYLQLLEERASQLLSQGKPAEYPMSMTAAWSISVASLAGRMPEAVDLLRYCAFFGPEPIPRDVFSVTRVPLSSRLAELTTNRIKLGSAIGELGRFALIRIDPKARTLQVHRLIQALLREELSEEQKRVTISDIHQLLVGALPDNPDEAVNWPVFSSLVAHVEPTHVEDSTVPNVRELAINIIRYLYLSGDWGTAVQLVKRYIARWTEISGPDDPDVLRALREQGNITREMGDYQTAFDLNQETLRRMRAVGLPDSDVLPLINIIGADLRAKGDFTEALRHDTESTRRHEEAFTREDPRTLRAINNLALDYSLTSQFGKSMELHQEAMNLADQKDRKIGASFYLAAQNGLARAARMNGEYGQACDLGEDAYAYGVEVLGVEHPWTLRTGKDLSIALRRNGEIERSRDLTVEIHKRSLRLYGLDHPDALAAATALCNVQRTTGQEREAMELVTDAIARYGKIYGRAHPYTLACTGNLAVLTRVTGSPEQALELNTRTLTALEDRVGARHHYSLQMAANLASDHAAIGDLDQARAIGERTLVHMREVLGPDHPMTLLCAANLAMDLAALHLDEQADELGSDTLSRLELKLPRDHPDIVVFRSGHHLDCDFDPPPI
jgi:tetratricopeptide (TPR) repeat protein